MAGDLGEKAGTGLVEHFDAIVVGSGFGGAVAACRLAQAGFSVLVLERGRRYEANDFPALPDDDRLAPDLRRWVWSTDEGLWDIKDLGEIVAVQAAGYGGGSLLYANVHLRPPADRFDNEHWPSKFHKEALEGYYDLAAFMLDAAPIAKRPGDPFTKTLKLDAVIEKLGREPFRPPLAINYVEGRNKFGEWQGACTGCGKCCTGCPEKAKNTLDHNYLALAEQNGAEPRTQCEVKRVVQPGADSRASKQHWTVEYVNHLTASYVSVTAQNVFLCAGVVNTANLLQKAKLRRECRSVQQRVGLGYFPNADAAGMVYDTNEECSPSSGPCITTAAVHWESNVERPGACDEQPSNERFFMIQDGGYAPELERLLGVLRAPLWAGRNRSQTAADVAKQSPSPARPRTPLPNVALVSPLDGLLDARGGGALAGMVPPALRAAWDGFLRELERPILMSAIVACTVERASRGAYDRLPKWLKRVLKYESWPVRGFKGLFRAFLRLTGGNAEVGHHALGGILAGSDLDRHTYLQDTLGYDGRDPKRRMLLLAMGEDAAPGALLFDKAGVMRADLDLFHLADGYTNQELLMKDMARELGGELRLNPAWSFVGKPITVHSQGGCRMSEEPEDGVTNPNGEVHGCPGLFVMDGSVLCRSVGVNPTPTILAIAERNILDFITSERPGWPTASAGKNPSGAAQYLAHREGARAWSERAKQERWHIAPVKPQRRVELQSAPLGIRFSERFHGYCAPIPPASDPMSADPKGRRSLNVDSAHRLLEIAGRPAHSFELDLNVSCQNLHRFFEDLSHRLELDGTIEFTLPGVPHSGEKLCPVTGFLELLVPRHKPYGLPSRETRRVQSKATGYTYRTRKGEPDPNAPRFMYYHLSVGNGDELRLEGYKRIRNDPGLDAWRDTTALFTRFGRPSLANGKKSRLGGPIDACAAGVIHVNLTDFLYREVPSFQAIGGEGKLPLPPNFEVTGTTDPARLNWAAGKFISFFFGTLQRVYAPAAINVADALFQPVPNGVRHQRLRRRA